MKTKEQVAAEIYSSGRDSVMRGGHSLQDLARHIDVMVNGANPPTGRIEGPLWKDRAWPDKTIHLESFEDYLLKPAREGLDIPSLLWLWRVLDAHEDRGEREKALQALRREIQDFDAKVEKERARELVKRPEPSGPRGAPVGNQNAAKGEENKGDNINFESKPKKRGKGTDPDYIVSRLKRDASTDPKAESLLGSIEAGDIKPYRAAVEMGWVKAPDPAAIVDKQREKMSIEDQVRIWQEWGRSLPDDAIDRIGIAKEAFLNLYETEQHRFMTWARKAIKGAA